MSDINDWPRRIHLASKYHGISRFLEDGEVLTSGCVYMRFNEWHKLNQEIARLKELLAKAGLALKKLSNHSTCDDGWYSCPASGECLDKNRGNECDCGAQIAVDALEEIRRARESKNE